MPAPLEVTYLPIWLKSVLVLLPLCANQVFAAFWSCFAEQQSRHFCTCHLMTQLYHHCAQQHVPCCRLCCLNRQYSMNTLSFQGNAHAFSFSGSGLTGVHKLNSSGSGSGGGSLTAWSSGGGFPLCRNSPSTTCSITNHHTLRSQLCLLSRLRQHFLLLLLKRLDWRPQAEQLRF